MLATLIGTRAYRPSGTDVDILCDREFADSFAAPDDQIYDLLIPEPGSAWDELLHVSAGWDRSFLDGVTICPPIFLKALKRAHLILPVKWRHHITEYRELCNLAPEELDNFALQIYRMHRRECLEKAKRPPKLAVSKDQFFDHRESYNVFDHDSIHRAVAAPSEPAYTLMQDGEVWCSRKKWYAMDEDTRLRCLIEEACVLALERSIIPALYQGKSYAGVAWAYEFALEKIATTITSGWFRDYAIERYWDAVAKRPKYAEAFLNGLSNGIVKKYGAPVSNTPH